MAVPNSDSTPDPEAQHIVDAELVDDDPTDLVEVVGEESVTAAVVDEAVPQEGEPEATEVAEPAPVTPPPASPEWAAPPEVSAAAQPLTAAAAPEAPAAPAAPAAAPAAPAAAAAAEQPNVVYVQTPLPPRAAGNGGFAVLIAVLGTIAFALSLAVVTYLISVGVGAANIEFLGELKFWLPVIVFAIVFVLMALILNRAPWWAHVLLSLVVGFAVYFGTIGAGLLADWLVAREVGDFADGLVSPFVIIAAVLAREVAVWFGAAISVRGRRVAARNREAREAFERELAEYRARYSV